RSRAPLPPALPGDRPRVGIDVGGTFTDVVIVRGGSLAVCKVPTTPDDQSEGFDLGLRQALESAGAASPSLVAHGTTVATNAVLERRGGGPGPVPTGGFAGPPAHGRPPRPPP